MTKAQIKKRMIELGMERVIKGALFVRTSLHSGTRFVSVVCIDKFGDMSNYKYQNEQLVCVKGDVYVFDIEHMKKLFKGGE